MLVRRLPQVHRRRRFRAPVNAATSTMEERRAHRRRRFRALVNAAISTVEETRARLVSVPLAMLLVVLTLYEVHRRRRRNARVTARTNSSKTGTFQQTLG